MTSPNPDDLLRRALQELDRSETIPAGRAGEIDVVRLLVDLSARGSEASGDRDRETLEILCRRIAVGKMVFRSYREDWKRVADSRPLSATGWRLLIALLLARSRIADADQTDFAQRVKYLNAALHSLDIAGALGEAHELAPLRACAEGILEALAESLPATAGAPAP